MFNSNAISFFVIAYPNVDQWIALQSNRRGVVITSRYSHLVMGRVSFLHRRYYWWVFDWHLGWTHGQVCGEKRLIDSIFFQYSIFSLSLGKELCFSTMCLPLSAVCWKVSLKPPTPTKCLLLDGYSSESIAVSTAVWLPCISPRSRPSTCEALWVIHGIHFYFFLNWITFTSWELRFTV